MKKTLYSCLLAITLGAFMPTFLLAAGTTLVADFSADKVNVLVGEVVTFSDLSQIGTGSINEMITWTWDFGVGASPMSVVIESITFPVLGNFGPNAGSNQQISYLTPGLKDVSLTLTSTAVGVGAIAETKVAYINVLAAPIPTLSEWSLILLTLLLLGMGTLTLMQPSLQAKGANGYSFSMKGRNWTFPYSEKHFVQAMAVTAGLMVLGYGASVWFTGGIASSDLIGGMLVAPVFAYLLHMMLGLKGE